MFGTKQAYQAFSSLSFPTIQAPSYILVQFGKAQSLQRFFVEVRDQVFGVGRTSPSDSYQISKSIVSFHLLLKQLAH